MSEDFAGAAPFGDDLAILVSQNDSRPQYSIVRRTPDGTFTEMPLLPAQGAFRIGSAGDTILVGGVACGEESQCTDGNSAVFQLRPSSGKWEQVYSGSQVLGSEVEISVTVGPARFAQFSIGDTGILLGEDGLVSDDLPRPKGEAFKDLRYAYFCDLGDRAVIVPAVPDPDPGSGEASNQYGVQTTRANGSVWELRYDAAYNGWIEVAEAPRDMNNIGAHTECAGSQMVIHNDDAKWTYDTVTQAWSTGPSKYRQLTGSQVFSAKQPGEIAVSSGDSGIYSVVAGKLLERTRLGDWEATNTAADQIYATTSGAILVTLTPGEKISFSQLSK